MKHDVLSVSQLALLMTPKALRKYFAFYCLSFILDLLRGINSLLLGFIRECLF